ncbi:MAG: hypothetical protein ACPGVO_01280 [Spirulinaceae cyanobacterium]
MSPLVSDENQGFTVIHKAQITDLRDEAIMAIEEFVLTDSGLMSCRLSFEE